jgi:hypothetical protein
MEMGEVSVLPLTSPKPRRSTSSNPFEGEEAVDVRKFFIGSLPLLLTTERECSVDEIA